MTCFNPYTSPCNNYYDSCYDPCGSRTTTTCGTDFWGDRVCTTRTRNRSWGIFDNWFTPSYPRACIPYYRRPALHVGVHSGGGVVGALALVAIFALMAAYSPHYDSYYCDDSYWGCY